MQLRAFLFVLFALLHTSIAGDFENNFKNCHLHTPSFDFCVQEGLNMIQPYFKTGLPKYNVLPFDPFFAKEISVSRGIPNFGFTLTLRNVTEYGWALSKVTKFVSDLKNYKVTYTQSFPDKLLVGYYELKGRLLNSTAIYKGRFTLRLFDLIQTTIVTKLPGQKVRAQMDVQSIRGYRFNTSSTNYVPAKQLLDNIINKIANYAWQPIFTITRDMTNEFVSTGFTEIFDNAFRNFPFEKLFKSKLSIN